ncbi:MAG: motility associated factor glycosyltransferase family protein [Spirochaetaceae bacterium]|nr:motility associated factor glycosyltransferase family protein [Spirochaetaceae bacterium]
MNFLEDNLKSLNRRFPLLYESLKTHTDSLPDYPVELSREGSPTIQINGSYIHSKFDPRREALRFVENEISPKAGLVVFAGMGLGYHIEEFLDSDDTRNILVIEPDQDFFLFSLSLRDLRKTILSDRLQFLIGCPPEDCSMILEQHPGKTIQLVKLRSVYAKDQDFYDNLDTFIRNYVSRKEINLSTLQRFGKLWVRNLSINAEQLHLSPGIYTLQGSFSDYPALLIAAGPSLDNLKPHLKELKKRFLLVSVDTSLRACLEKGVEPDFTVVVDPQYWNSRHLDHCSVKETILLSETSTYPTVFRQLKGKTFLCSSSFPLGLYLEERTELKGKLKAGGSVATAAWDFCRTLSIENIWCAGLDLGFPFKQTHCRGSFFEQRAHWLSNRYHPSETFSWHALIDAGIREVESNSGHVTYTDKRMSVYSRWFEEQMDKYVSINSWNLSDEGIKIKGMPRKTIEEALKMPLIRDELDNILHKIKSIETGPDLQDKLDTALQSLIDELKSLMVLAEKGMNTTKDLKRAFKDNKDIQGTLGKLTELDQLIINSMSKDIAGFILQNFINSLLKDNKKKSGLEIIQNSYTLYHKLFHSAEFHIDLLKNCSNMTKKT